MSPTPQLSAPSHTPIWQRRDVCAAAWLGCLLLCVSITLLTDYHVHDPDSRLYAAMAQDMAQQPLAHWCAPTWNGHWGRQGLFYEHPPGLLWAGAALISMGCSPLQALYLCNFVTLFGSLALLWAVAHALQSRHGRAYPAWGHLGLVAVGIWICTPAFLQYLVRGNQEHPLCFAILLGLLALVTHRHALWVTALWSVALIFGMAVKGVAACALLPIAALYLARYDRSPTRIIAVGAGCLIACGAAVAYDQWVWHITGASFWEHYFAGQVQFSVGAHTWAHKFDNVLYYAARPLWFGLPAVILLMAHASQWSRQAQHRNHWPAATGLGLLVTLVFVAGFSIANRKADRYIFPVYPALALAAANFVIQQPRWRAWVARWQHALPYACMGVLLLAVVLKIYIGTYHYAEIRWWRGG